MAFQDDRSKPSKSEISHEPGVRGQRPSVIDAHKAALEALFAPRVPSPVPPPVAKRDSAKLVVARKRDEDPAREKLVARLLAAEGRAAVTKHAGELLRAGFAFPDEQEVHLQLLDHADEARVRESLGALERLLAAAAPKRKPVLESRLRRLEEGAEDESTRALATALRRKLAGR